MNINHDTGTLDTILTIDVTRSPPAGGDLGVLTIIGSGGIRLPSGSTADRPVNLAGVLRYNTDANGMEYSDSIGNWVEITTNTYANSRFVQTNDARLTDARATPTSIVLQLNNGTTEGLDQYTFNGTVRQQLNIVAGRNMSLATTNGSVIIHSTVLDASGNLTSAADIQYNGTLTGGNGTVNIGSGQIYKDTTGNVGIGTTTPSSKLTVIGDTKINNITVGLGSGQISTNTTVGYQSLYSNTTGAYNETVGYQSLYSNTTGGSNTAVGYHSLYSNTTGVSNTAVGHQSSSSMTTGTDNIASGRQSLYSNTVGSYNTAIGSRSLISNAVGSHIVAVGAQSLYSNNTSYNTAIGGFAMYSNTTGGGDAIGFQSLYSNTTGGNNTAVGLQSLYSNTTGGSNTAVGRYALFGNTTGGSNTAVGAQSLYSNTSNNCTAVGAQSLYSNTTGFNCTAVGLQSLYSNTTGVSNTAIGSNALEPNTTGSNNVAVGFQTLYSNTTGSGNVCLASVTSSGNYAPVFNITSENNRIVMGHTSVTNAYVQVAWTVVSDARDKTQITPLDKGLDFINKLNPVSFKFRMCRDSNDTCGGKRYGFLAQDVLAVEGDDNVIVDNEDPTKLKMTNEELIPILVNAIKELTIEIETLKGR